MYFIGSKVIPPDGPQNSFYFDSEYLSVLSKTLTILDLIFMALVSLTVVLNRNSPDVRQKSLVLLTSIIAGSSIIGLSNLYIPAKPSPISCNLVVVLPLFGFSIIHGALFGREMLIQTIFSQRNWASRRNPIQLLKIPILSGASMTLVELALLIMLIFFSDTIGKTIVKEGAVAIICSYSNSNQANIVSNALWIFNSVVIFSLLCVAIINRDVPKEYSLTNQIILYVTAESLGFAVIYLILQSSTGTNHISIITKQTISIFIYSGLTVLWFTLPIFWNLGKSIIMIMSQKSQKLKSDYKIKLKKKKEVNRGERMQVNQNQFEQKTPLLSDSLGTFMMRWKYDCWRFVEGNVILNLDGKKILLLHGIHNDLCIGKALHELEITQKVSSTENIIVLTSLKSKLPELVFEFENQENLENVLRLI
jgi:hypothetical protein